MESSYVEDHLGDAGFRVDEESVVGDGFDRELEFMTGLVDRLARRRAPQGRAADLDVEAPEQVPPRLVQVEQFREPRSEEHTSELQSLAYLVCRLLLEKKK